MSAKLDEIRADLTARHEKAQAAMYDATRDLALAEVALNTFERTVAAMPDIASAAAPDAPKRADRRDIADLVHRHLTAEFQRADVIGRAAGVSNKLLLPALERLKKAGRARSDSGGEVWARVGFADAAPAADESEVPE